MSQEKYTLDTFARRKQALKQQLDANTEQMRRRYNMLFAPPPESHNIVERYVNYAEQTWALIDGVRTGYKLLGALSGIFHIRKRRKH